MEELFNLLNNFGSDVNIEKLDLTKEADLEKFKKTINDLKSNKLFSSMISLFVGEDVLDNFLDNALTIGQSIYDKAHEVPVEEEKEEEKEEKKEETTIPRPSVNLSVEAGLQIHRLVQEYVDTMIKPYAKGIMNDKQINDAYAGIYEYSAWLYNHK